MEFFNSAIEVLQTLVVALGAGLGVWGAINLLEGYGNDNPGSKAHGIVVHGQCGNTSYTRFSISSDIDLALGEDCLLYAKN